MVYVSLVVIVQGSAAPLTVPDVAPLKDEEATRFFDVITFREDPVLVLKLGVTVNEMELSPVCIEVSLLVYDSEPVRRVT